MAKFKARMPVVAKRVISTTTPATLTFDDGLAIGKLVQVSVTPNSTDVKFYADDGIAEQEVSFVDAAISLNVSTVPNDVAEMIYGALHTAAAGSSPETLEWSDLPSKHVGFGFISTEMVDNEEIYKVSWFPKCIFALPSEQYDTKGETTTFNASTITATAAKDDYTVDAHGDSLWKQEFFYSSAADAITKLKALADIT